MFLSLEELAFAVAAFKSEYDNPFVLNKAYVLGTKIGFILEAVEDAKTNSSLLEYNSPLTIHPVKAYPEFGVALNV